jgi:small subunit ribosomal protein S6
MTTDQQNVYEGMFLFAHSMAANLQEASDHVKELLDRAGAEIISFRKWDERRLAFEIKGNKRGVYFLAYFKALPDSLAGLERDCNLSEKVLRAMWTRAEHITAEEIAEQDGQQQLADEINLRQESAESGPAVATVAAPAPAAAAAPAATAAEPPAEG